MKPIGLYLIFSYYSEEEILEKPAIDHSIKTFPQFMKGTFHFEVRKCPSLNAILNQ